MNNLRNLPVLQVWNEIYRLNVEDVGKLRSVLTWKMWGGGDASSSSDVHAGDSEDEANMLRIGVVDRWRDERFLHNGCYSVHIPDVHSTTPRRFQNMEMDFVSVSHCMLTEGQAMYLIVDHETYKLLRSMYPGFMVYEDAVLQETHETLLEKDGSTVVQFECYYILNDTKHEDPMEMGMRLLLPVARKVDGQVLQYADSRENQLILYANVYHEGRLRVRPTPFPEKMYALHKTFLLADQDEKDYEEVESERTPGSTAVWD